MVAGWLAWLAGWLVRVELERRARGLIEVLGLARERERMGWCIVASGTVDGAALSVRWGRGLFGPTVRVRASGQRRWLDVPPGADVEGHIRACAAGMLSGGGS